MLPGQHFQNISWFNSYQQLVIVKFTYAGGLVVTKYMNYIVGDDCNGNTSDTDGPNNFTATLGEVGSDQLRYFFKQMIILVQ